MTYGDIWGFETDRLFTPEDFTGFDADGNPTGYAPGVPTQVGIQTGSFVYGPGDTKYKDLNGDGKIDGGEGTADNHGDLKVIGNTQPRYQYSFRLGGSWKGFDLDIFFQGIGKRDVWSQSAFVIPYYRGADAIYSNQMDYWKGTFSGGKWTVTNADAEYPRLYAGNNGIGKVPGIDRGDKNFYPQSKWLSHMAYLRLKNLTFGYTLPQHLTRKILSSTFNSGTPSADTTSFVTENSSSTEIPLLNASIHLTSTYSLFISKTFALKYACLFSFSFLHPDNATIQPNTAKIDSHLFILNTSSNSYLLNYLYNTISLWLIQ